MHTNNMIPKSIAIAYQPNINKSVSTAKEIAAFLHDQGVEHTYQSSIHTEELKQKSHNGEFDLMVVVGGDGSMLRAGRTFGPVKLPILGINLGNFGFLIEVQINEWKEALLKILKGEYRLEDRMMLKIEHVRNERVLGRWEALNEIVICRGQIVRPIRLKASVDGYTLASYVADGLIIATPTGSTAYSLAAGGPILPPELRNLLIIPVAPHLSVDRAVILSEGACVTVQSYTEHEAVLSVDGQPPVFLQNGDVVRASASENLVSFVRMQDPGYFYRNLMNYMEQNPSTGKMK